MPPRPLIALACPSAWALLWLAVTLHASADGPLTGMTGGFGEPTCHQCHFDQPIGDPMGRVAVSGVPPVYVPGARYAIKLALERPGVSRGGFQMAVRFASGPEAGRQAGLLRAVDDRVQVVSDPARA